MQSFITFILSNFTLTFFVIGIITTMFSLIQKRNRITKHILAEVILAHFILFNIGVAYFYNFIMHVFFGGVAAHFIGWSQSPFQAEVGFASLGFSVVGIIAFWQNLSFRVPVVIAPAFFLLGAAGGHIYQMMKFNNFAPGNAGVIFWTDLLIPLIGFILLYFQYKNPVKL